MSRRWAEPADVIGTKPVPTTASLGPLFSSTLEVHEATEKGIQDAHDHANEQWKSTAYAAIVQCARGMEKFSANDVWLALNGSRPATHNPSALGPLFRLCASKGMISKTNEVTPSNRTSQHRAATVWASHITDR